MIYRKQPTRLNGTRCLWVEKIFSEKKSKIIFYRPVLRFFVRIVGVWKFTTLARTGFPDAVFSSTYSKGPTAKARRYVDIFGDLSKTKFVSIYSILTLCHSSIFIFSWLIDMKFVLKCEGWFQIQPRHVNLTYLNLAMKNKKKWHLN